MKTLVAFMVLALYPAVTSAYSCLDRSYPNMPGNVLKQYQDECLRSLREWEYRLRERELLLQQKDELLKLKERELEKLQVEEK